MDSNECFILGLDENTHKVHVATHSIKDGSLLYHYTHMLQYYDIMCVAIGWCLGDRFAAITNGTKTLFIQNLNQPHLRAE